jgi:hypothetical protein
MTSGAMRRSFRATLTGWSIRRKSLNLQRLDLFRLRQPVPDEFAGHPCLCQPEMASPL